MVVIASKQKSWSIDWLISEIDEQKQVPFVLLHFNLISTKGPAIPFSIPLQRVVFEILIKGTHVIAVSLALLSCERKVFKHLKAVFLSWMWSCTFRGNSITFTAHRETWCWLYSSHPCPFLCPWVPDRFKTEKATKLVLGQAIPYRSYNYTVISKLNYIYN